MIDYHIHTAHSTDAEGSLEEYCGRALQLGLREVCFTNHCELDPRRDDNVTRQDGRVVPVTPASLAAIQEDVARVRERFRKKGLTVRFGLEVGYQDGVDRRLEEVASKLELDYLIAGIHCLEHICIDSSREHKDYFQKNSAGQLLAKYYRTAAGLAGCGLFDSLAHLDVYKKYGIGFYGADEMRRFPPEETAEVFRNMARQELALEINTAGLRRVGEFFPGPQIMRLARDAGVSRITIGSDCHRVDDLGKGIKDGLEYARSFGFTTVCGFEKRKPYLIKI